MGRAAGFLPLCAKVTLSFSKLCSASWAPTLSFPLWKNILGAFINHTSTLQTPTCQPPTLQERSELTLPHHLSHFPPEIIGRMLNLSVGSSVKEVEVGERKDKFSRHLPTKIRRPGTRWKKASLFCLFLCPHFVFV